MLLAEWDTEQSADAIETYPQAAPYPLFACGTYQLIEEDVTKNQSRDRIGRVTMLQYNTDTTSMFVISLPSLLKQEEEEELIISWIESRWRCMRRKPSWT